MTETPKPLIRLVEAPEWNGNMCLQELWVITEEGGTDAVCAHLTECVGGNYHSIGQSFSSPAPDTAYTLTVWLKSANRHAWIQMNSPEGGGGSNISIDLVTGEIWNNMGWGGGFPNWTDVKTVDAGNGWWKCTGTIIPPGYGDLGVAIGSDKNRSADPNYPGDGESFLQIWQPALVARGESGNCLATWHDLCEPPWECGGAEVENYPEEELPTERPPGQATVREEWRNVPFVELPEGDPAKLMTDTFDGALLDDKGRPLHPS
jgi:hypothetical protein